jgi:hypothetical protein
MRYDADQTVRMHDTLEKNRTLGTFCLILVAVAFVCVSSVVVVNTEASCRVPMQLGPSPGTTCNGHECSANMHDVKFKFGNCSDRSALEYCYVDVKERRFYEQELCLQKELVRGVRVFFIDVHMQGKKLRACHRWCTVKLTTVDEMLSIFTEFLRLNPREVLIIWWFPEGDKQSIVSELRHMYFKTGLARYSFIPNEPKWPTIGELVERNTRLVSLWDSPGVVSYEFLTYGNLTE